jgi:hypothetical protein
MIEGLLRHDTAMEVEKNYVDSHGQSEVAFAFCHLLGFRLLPRLKAIHVQKLCRAEVGQPEAYSNLQPVLTRPIDWQLIQQQYDQMIKYATALRLGTAETEAILKRFTRNNLKHPTYLGFAELGKAIKTIFLCRYLHSEALRREIQEGLNVIETWNGTNSFILYGKGDTNVFTGPSRRAISRRLKPLRGAQPCVRARSDLSTAHPVRCLLRKSCTVPLDNHFPFPFGTRRTCGGTACSYCSGFLNGKDETGGALVFSYLPIDHHRCHGHF